MKSRLSIENIKKAFDNIDPVFLNTPQFICDSLSEILNCKVILKVETLNPIRCFKGRSAFNYVSNLKEGSTLVCASAGNLGQAVAYACSKKNIKPIIFASKNANPLKIERMKSLGAEVVLKGEDFDDARIFAKKYALKNNFDLIEDSLDINTCEGAGTIGMELLKLDTHLDAVLVALGNGGLLTGVARCIKEYSPNTEVIGVVAKGAPAMAKSFEKNCLKSLIFLYFLNFMSIIFLYWRFFVGGWMFFGVLGGMLVKKVLAERARTWVVFYYSIIILIHLLI